MSSDHAQQALRLFEAAALREPEERVAFLDEACRDDPALRAEVDSLLALRPEAKRFLESPALGTGFHVGGGQNDPPADEAGEEQTIRVGRPPAGLPNRSGDRATSCLSDENLAALFDGSSDADQLATWKAHLTSCDSCTLRYGRKQAGLEPLAKPDAPSGPADDDGSARLDATVTVKPIGRSNFDAGAASGPGDATPGYQILKELHRGGQGVVYQAIQESTKRKVALKVMLEGPFAGPASKRRFEREIELVASLRHPGIVPIYDSGVARGQFYYAMEYIRGESLSQYVQSHKLNVDDTLRLFAKVCDAVDYAHQRGVIHRDLKPSNILVDERGDTHVLDFGLAKIAGADATGDAQSRLVSVTGQIMGTLAYMSPEQAAGRPDQVDMRSDVYGLGIVLYELLTGQFPYDVTGQMATVLTTIQEVEPNRPSVLRREVNDEVETIVLKALAKEKDRRYVTAGMLGQDVTRYLAGDPIEAKRDSVLYVLRKTLRRYKAPAAVAAGFALLLVASSIVAWGLFARANTARETAETAQRSERQAKEEFRQSAYFQQIGSAWGAWQSNDLTRFRRLLEDCDKDLRGWEWQHFNYRRQHIDRQARVIAEHPGAVLSLALSPDGERIATGGYDGALIVWNVETGRELGRVVAHEGDPVAGVAFSPDGTEIISGGLDNGGVKLWDVHTGKPRKKDEEWPTVAGVCLRPAAFSSNGTKIVLVGEAGNVIRVWDREKKKENWNVTIEDIDDIWWVAFSPDDQYVAAGISRGLAVFDAATGKLAWKDRNNRGESEAPGVFSPDGTEIIGSTEDWVVRSWNVERGGRPDRFSGHTSTVHAVTFNSRGDRIVSGGSDRTVRLWDVASGKELRTFHGHEGIVMAVAFSPDGKTIFSGGEDGKIRAWAVDSRDEPPVVLERGNTESVAVSPDGKWIAIGRNMNTTRGGGIRILDLATEGRVVDKPIFGHVGPDGGNAYVTSVAFSPDSRTLASCGQAWAGPRVPMQAMLWDVPTGEKLAVLPHKGAVLTVAFSPNERWVATASYDKTVGIWDAATGRPVTLLDYGAPCRATVFSPDGRTLAAGGDGGKVKFWDTATWQPRADELNHGADKVWSIAYSRDGERIAAGGAIGKLHGKYKVWNVRTLEPGLIESEVAGSARALTFTPDGSRIVGGSADGSVRVWDVETGEEALALPVLAAGVAGVAFSPDARQLVVTGADFTVKILHATSFEDEADRGGARLAGMTLTPDDPDVLFRLRTAYVLADDMTTLQGWGEPLDYVKELIQRSRRRAAADGDSAGAFFDALVSYATKPQHWWIVGPFIPDADAKPLEQEFAPEKSEGPIDLTTIYRQGSGEPLGWQHISVGMADVTELGMGYKMRGALGLLPLAPKATNVAAYALTYLHSDIDQDVTLWFNNSADAAKMWLNGDREAVYNQPESGLKRRVHRAPVRLKKGSNSLLFKVAQGSGVWALVVEAVDANGWPARVTWSASPEAADQP